MNLVNSVITFSEREARELQYERISGDDIAGNKTEKLQEIVDLFDELNFSTSELEELDTFEQALVAAMLIGYHTMLPKHKDYGRGNIDKKGESGILDRLEDKVARGHNMIGNPDRQLLEIKDLLRGLPDDANVQELNEFAWAVDNVVSIQNAVNGETMDDTWTDIGNYGFIGLLFHNDAWGKPLE